MEQPCLQHHTDGTRWCPDLSSGPGFRSLYHVDPSHRLASFLFLFPVCFFLLPFSLPLFLLPPLGSNTEEGPGVGAGDGVGLGMTCNPRGPSLSTSPQAYERQVPPRAVINSAGYKILTSVDQYLELVGNSLPGKGAPVPGRNALHRPRGLAQGECSPDPGVPGSTFAERPAGPGAAGRCPA